MSTLAATLCNVPASCSVDQSSVSSLVSLDWVLAAAIRTSGAQLTGTLLLNALGARVSMPLTVPVHADLSYDLILGQDWLLFCPDMLPDTTSRLSSGLVQPGKPAVAAAPPHAPTSPTPMPRTTPVDIASQSLHAPPPMPFDEGDLADILLDPDGVVYPMDGGSPIMSLCPECISCLRRNKTPALALANRNYLAPVPPELQDLTMIEESMIARSRAKCWIVKLKEENQNLELPTTQRGMKGHVIVYPQHPSRVDASLPPSIEEITAPVCVLFVGASKPTPEWLSKHAKPLAVNAGRVRRALDWLKAHNPLYRRVQINEERLRYLEENPVLPFNIEHIQPNTANEATTSRYDSMDSFDPGTNTTGEIPFENIVIADVECHASANELRAAALRHVKKNGGGYLQLPHDRDAENDFRSDGLLFPLIYPTLFPYGIGGPNDSKRPIRLSLKRHIKHLLSLNDRRFQEHPSFAFTAFNILQRHDLLLHTSLKVKRSNFDAVASQFATVSPQVVKTISERVANGESPAPKNPEEQKVLTLLKQVNAVVTSVPGSSAARVAMRNEIRGLMIEQGMPSFYITINPADVFSPVLKFMSGAEIDIDALLPEDVPNYWDQASVIAKNPVVAARFFNVYMKTFINTLLGFDPAGENLDGGILGVVKAHYGCVEAQGRGTLHCHMLVWVEGGLNPNEIRKRALGIADEDVEFRERLVRFLDDTISNSIPAEPAPTEGVQSDVHNPCSVRGIRAEMDQFPAERQKDLRNVAIQCQKHTHSKTCFKYWPGPPHPKTCRFDLHEDNYRAETVFDPETGEINLRCLDGLVNNFNATILEAVRNNMDIKFIGSGTSAKAILYYITDYITKSQLKTHVAFAMLELAVKKLGEFKPGEDEISIRGKRLLQKCAYAMISQQELSGQQVASYLLDFEDHFTSHSFRNFHWTPFEASINADDPSPECYVTKKTKTTEADPPANAQNGEDDSSDSESDSDDGPQFLNDLLEDADAGREDEQAEVQVGFDDSGRLVRKGGSALQDYRLRGRDLDARHPSQDVRDEFRRLDLLAAQTMMEHGTAEESREAQSYIVNTFSADALPQEHDDIIPDDAAGGARRLDRLQRDNSRLIGQGPSARKQSSKTPRKRIQRVGKAHNGGSTATYGRSDSAGLLIPDTTVPMDVDAHILESRTKRHREPSEREGDRIAKRARVQRV
ncbi:ATP-dependent DNA helicase [Mycena chlorophos]|uniref:ATP-dependent DNA helicase n=1 Tax=Mycena chlorophos TaxID=658473 RepID=A0A8H6TE40_MYCCL|nr:ATP-dependent DNA helicase [Mycena chlorophos]